MIIRHQRQKSRLAAVIQDLTLVTD